MDYCFLCRGFIVLNINYINAILRTRMAKYSSTNFYMELEQLSKKYFRLSAIEKSKAYGKHSFEIGKALGLHHFLDGFLISFGQTIATECKKTATPVAPEKPYKAPVLVQAEPPKGKGITVPTAIATDQPVKRKPGRPKKV